MTSLLYWTWSHTLHPVRSPEESNKPPYPLSHQRHSDSPSRDVTPGPTSQTSLLLPEQRKPAGHRAHTGGEDSELR